MAKILIIEDNPEIAGLIRDSLIAQGFEATTCPDAYQGIEFTHRMKPDLILLDLMLPAGGGFNVLENVKLSVHTKGIPVIVLTASKDSKHKDKALELGVVAFLEKPFDFKELINKIKEVLHL